MCLFFFMHYGAVFLGGSPLCMKNINLGMNRFPIMRKTSHSSPDNQDVLLIKAFAKSHSYREKLNKNAIFNKLR